MICTVNEEGQGVNFLGRNVTASLTEVPDGTTLPIPEPETWVLFLGGCGFIGCVMRRGAWRVRFG